MYFDLHEYHQVSHTTYHPETEVLYTEKNNRLTDNHTDGQSMGQYLFQ